jgi:hypothetical protein
MNVKITYSVPLEKVPDKINELVKETEEELQKISQQLASFPSRDFIVKIDTIDSIRRQLASVDFLLEDCYSILTAYNKTLAELRMPQSKKTPKESKIDESENN